MTEPLSAHSAPATGPARRPFLVIENVTKRFAEFTALKGVSLTVGEGEFICFLGPSGCGKTTLLRAIAGLDIQTSGTIHQAGRDISALPPEERDFGIVFQSYALFPNLTVRQNIGFGLVNRGLKRADVEARVDELLALIGLTEHGHKYPAQISGGQQQRVALARALAPRPGLILLDEPLSALDAKVRIHLRAELKQLQERLGVTMVMVTHDQEEALSIADRIVVMNMGVVEQIGTPEEIYDHPASRFVADFIGAMNFLDGVVTGPGAVQIDGLGITVSGPLPATGHPVVVAVRPEDVRLGVPGTEVTTAANPIPVTVGQVEFLGSHIRVALRHPAFRGRPLIAQITQTDARDLRMTPGRPLEAILPTDRVRAFAAPAHAGTARTNGASHG